MSKFLDYQDTSRFLIEVSGGEVSKDGPFVEKPGVALIKDQGKVNQGLVKMLVEKFNINANQSVDNQLAELAARITYLSFPASPESDEEAKSFHTHLKDAGHLSPYRTWDDNNTIFLIGGCTVETVLELAANKGATIARQTSSRTASMNNPFYRVQGTEPFRTFQKKIITASLKARAEIVETTNPKDFQETGKTFHEFLNMTLPANKTLSLFIGRDLENWEKTFQKRFDKIGVETELREVLSEIRTQLEQLYPELIKSEEYYYSLNKNS